MKKILLVGGSGFLGSHLCADLEKNHLVTISGTKEKKKLNYVLIDYSKHATFNKLKNNKFDLVVFLTSTITGMDSKKIPGTDFKINVSGFSNFLQFIIDNKVSKNLIYISSMTVYSKEDNIPVNENSSKIPPNSYGLSKYLAERIFKYACINNDFNGVVLRLPGLYGGNRKNGFIYNIIKRLKTNKPIDLKIENIEYWETININDATKLITELIKNYKWQKSYEVYNVSYGQKTDLIETARYIKKCLSSKSKINIPKKINYVDFYMDNKKIKKLTNFSMNYFDSLKNHINENN